MTFDSQHAGTFATTAASNKIDAVAQDDGDTIVIRNGSTVVGNGETTTWATGSNTLTVVVTDGLNPTISTTYTVTVTKS